MLKTSGRYAYSPIVSRPQITWPNGKRLAVYIALGIEEYVFGEGLAENLFAGASKPDLVNTAWRDYGNRVGAFRLIDRLRHFGIRPTVLLNTDVYESAGAVLETARGAGAEIVAHGRSNSDTLATMNAAEEGRYIAAVRDRIAREEGLAPLGWSSPWLAHSASTIDSLAQSGFGYLLDLRLDDQPTWLKAQGGKLLSIPYALEINDSSTMIGRNAGARDFADMIVDEFDEMLAASAEQPLVMSVIVHSFISGQPFRLRAITRALEHLTTKAEEIWFTTPGEIAAAVAADPRLAA